MARPIGHLDNRAATGRLPESGPGPALRSAPIGLTVRYCHDGMDGESTCCHIPGVPPRGGRIRHCLADELCRPRAAGTRSGLACSGVADDQGAWYRLSFASRRVGGVRLRPIFRPVTSSGSSPAPPGGPALRVEVNPGRPPDDTCDHRRGPPPGPRLNTAARLPRRAWQRYSASGEVPKADRYHDWARAGTPTTRASPVTAGPPTAANPPHRRPGVLPLPHIPATSRWPPWSRSPGSGGRRRRNFQACKGLTGPDEHQVRRWPPGTGRTTLAMLALAFLTIATATEHAHPPRASRADPAHPQRDRHTLRLADHRASPEIPGTACDGLPGGDATSTAPEPATTSGKPASHDRNDQRRCGYRQLARAVRFIDTSSCTVFLAGPNSFRSVKMRWPSMEGSMITTRTTASPSGTDFGVHADPSEVRPRSGLRPRLT